MVEYRWKFIHKMVTLGFINKDNAPTIEAAQCLPSDFECHPTAILDKTVVIFTMNRYSRLNTVG